MLVQTINVRQGLASIKAKCAVCCAESVVDSGMGCDTEHHVATFTFDTLGFSQMYSRPGMALLFICSAFGAVNCQQ